MESNKEVRTVTAGFEIRKDGNNEPVIYGNAAVYGARSVVMDSWRGNYTEVIEPGFFSGVLDNDVIATIEHNPEKLVGRSTAGTLKLSDTPGALKTENKIPPTTIGNDLRILIERGDIKGMSFAFRCKEDGGSEWDTDETTGAITRTLKAGGCEKLYDVTYTCQPAYQDTSVAMRSILKMEEERKATPPVDETWKNDLKLKELQLTTDIL